MVNLYQYKTIVLPIRATETEIKFEDFKRFKKDIASFEHLDKLLKIITDPENKKYILKINFQILSRKEIEKKEIYSDYFKETEDRPIIEDDFIIITLKTTYNEEATKWESFIYENIIENLLYRLSLILNLTYEFSLDFLRGHIFGLDNVYLGKTEIIFSNLDFAYDSSYKLKWPKINGIPLEKTISWFEKHNISLSKSSNSKAGRAINAFSQMFGTLEEKNSSFLFWSVLGIEALLAEGNSNISNQIRTKCILLLGEPSEFKKKLGQLYNFRY